MCTLYLEKAFDLVRPSFLCIQKYNLLIMQGWEVTTIKQESAEGPVELKITLPSTPSVYISSFLFQACREIHSIGGHVLDKSTLQLFAGQLLEKVPRHLNTRKFLPEKPKP